jgi:rare lipoprotein A
MLAVAALFLAAACSSDPTATMATGRPTDQSYRTDGGMPRAMVNQPRQTRGTAGYDTVGIASWYGGRYHGRTTASGEVFDKYAPTAAHRTLPFGSWVQVTNLANGRSVTVKINDRGPFIDGRIIDVSRRVAENLGFIHQGITRVRVQLVRRGG